MIDLHTHSLLSDGEFLPSELARRAKMKGYRVIGISDHVDETNIEEVIPSLLKLLKGRASEMGIEIVVGAEITHVPKGLIRELTGVARKLGASYVVVHGETITEPVEEGTNRAAIEAGCDILAHPGLIEREDVVLARERGVFLEISGRRGHAFTNGHVARLAKEIGAPLIFNTDAHGSGDLLALPDAKKIVVGAGLLEEDFSLLQKNAFSLVERIRRDGHHLR